MTQNKDQNKLLVEEVIYNSSSDISENEISLINSLPAEHILEILETIMHQDSDTVIRSRAFESILKLKHLDKVKFLVDLYDNYEAEWGNVCCEYLAQFKNDERSQKKLCDIAINAEDADVRFNAIESLWKIGDPSCLPVLRYVAEHDNGLDYEGFPIKLFAKRVISDLLASS